MREDAKHGTHIQGAVELAVGSAAEIMEHMQRGSVYRTTEATNCNEVSSRSHAVLQVTVKAVQRYGEGGGSKRRLAKMSLIDLAGSERAYKTDNRGQRLVEGRNINRSLLSLANCINALADRTRKGARRPLATRDSRAAARQCFCAQARAAHDPSPRLGAPRGVRRHGRCIGAHVPYRDSKLTRLLKEQRTPPSGCGRSPPHASVFPRQDSLSGTSVAAMLCAVSPSSDQ